MIIILIFILLFSSQTAFAGSSTEMGARLVAVGIDSFKEQYAALPISDDHGKRSPELADWMGRSRAGCRIIKLGRNPQRNNFAAPQIENVLESCQRNQSCICHQLGEWDQGVNYLTGSK